MEREENPRKKDWIEVPEREINGRQNWSLENTCPYKNDHHKYTGGSNMCITYVTIMVTQYEKRSHVRFRGVMDTNEQHGSMLNKWS